MKTGKGPRSRVLWPIVLLLAAALALLAFPGSALAYEVLDQQQVSSANGGNVQFHGPLSVSQSFTAGHTGPLGKISVYVGGWSTYLMRAEIWSSSAMLGATELTVSNYSSHWQDITFAPAPTLTAGDRYSIVLKWVGNSFLWWFGGSDPYAAGAASFGPGSWDMCFKTYYYVADTTPPIVTPPENVTVEATSSAGAQAAFGSASANDVVDGPMPEASIHYYTGYGTADQAEVDSGDVFPLGATTITAAATDAHNNTGTATFTVSVVDTTSPVLTLPANITVDASGPSGGSASYDVSASDLVDGEVIPRVVPASGMTFPVGQTTVWVTAKDAVGNTSTGSFVVTVLGAAGVLDRLTGLIAEAPDDQMVPGGIAAVIKGSLQAKVNAATAALKRGNSNDAKAAMNDLKALINQVQAQTAKSISPEAAAAIILAANRVIDLAGGTSLDPPLPSTTGSFVGPDPDGTVWQVHVNALGSPVDPEGTSVNSLGTGTLSFTSRQSLPDGTEVEKAFTMTVLHHFGLEYFPFSGVVDAGAAVGICGPVIASSGAGIPAVGDYYLFLGWDGAQGFVNDDGTMGHYPDTWTFVPWGNEQTMATFMRNYQRSILTIWSNYGTSHYYPATSGQPGRFLPLWPVTQGDLSIQGGHIFP